jgi:hypothetical protein
VGVLGRGGGGAAVVIERMERRGISWRASLGVLVVVVFGRGRV